MVPKQAAALRLTLQSKCSDLLTDTANCTFLPGLQAVLCDRPELLPAGRGAPAKEQYLSAEAAYNNLCLAAYGEEEEEDDTPAGTPQCASPLACLSSDESMEARLAEADHSAMNDGTDGGLRMAVPPVG